MKNNKMGLNETWSMAVGAMIGGGIFSVLGVIIVRAGNLAWLSFLISGLIALATAISYSNLTNKFEEGGGAFTYIKDINHEGLAGGLSWLLILGYILSISVYAFTFGQYLENLLGFGPWFPRLISVIIISLFMEFNIKGAGEASWIEVITVWGKLIILLAIAIIGLWNFKPEMLVIEGLKQQSTFFNAVTGAATIFLAYQGFQLITYDYQEIHKPDQTIKKAEIMAIIAVIFVYILVDFGIVNLVSPELINQEKEVVIAIAGQRILGTAGLIIASIAALFSTGSAINSTVFATARLANKIAGDGELPHFLASKNNNNVPARAIFSISLISAILAIIGSLSSLVEAASFIFLITFAIVNFIAFTEINKNKFISLAGGIGAVTAALILTVQLINTKPFILLAMFILIIVVTAGRKVFYNKK